MSCRFWFKSVQRIGQWFRRFFTEEHWPSRKLYRNTKKANPFAYCKNDEILLRSMLHRNVGALAKERPDIIVFCVLHHGQTVNRPSHFVLKSSLTFHLACSQMVFPPSSGTCLRFDPAWGSAVPLVARRCSFESCQLELCFTCASTAKKRRRY